MKQRAVLLAGAWLAAGCSPNPRNAIPAIAEATLAATARQTHGPTACVERIIAPWQPPAKPRRVDPPPAGFELLLRPGVFRGGGGLKGDTVGRLPVGAGPTCLDLRGPLVAGDRAMVEVHLPGASWNSWLRHENGRWRVVAETRSDEPI